MTLDEAIRILRRMQEPEPWESQLTPIAFEALDMAIKALKRQEWIPFTERPLTDEEKEDYPDYDAILDCKLPDNGQRILVTIDRKGHEAVQFDEYYKDCDMSYLESGYDLVTEATAWMPLPEPYREDGD